MLNKKSIDDINVKGKRVLVRCDFNVPLQDGKITDENRLVAALPTIKKLIADGGKVILCSHLGKPKGEPKPELSLHEAGHAILFHLLPDVGPVYTVSIIPTSNPALKCAHHCHMHMPPSDARHLRLL